jgi:hypothetical protein
MSSVDPAVAQKLLQQMHMAAYGFAADLDYLHALEDTAAAWYGLRVKRPVMPDLITPRDLYARLQADAHPTIERRAA